MGSLDCCAIPKGGPCANVVGKSLAEGCGGAVGGELPTRFAGSRDRNKSTTLETAALEYVHYYHEDRTHLGLEKGTPNGRIRGKASGHVVSQERLGGLHHRYDRAALYRP